MGIYNLLAGSAGFTPLQASGGSLTTQVISGQTYNVHSFTSDGTFTVTQRGTGTVQVYMWGAGL